MRSTDITDGNDYTSPPTMRSWPPSVKSTTLADGSPRFSREWPPTSGSTFALDRRTPWVLGGEPPSAARQGIAGWDDDYLADYSRLLP